MTSGWCVADLGGDLPPESDPAWVEVNVVPADASELAALEAELTGSAEPRLGAQVAGRRSPSRRGDSNP